MIITELVEGQQNQSCSNSSSADMRAGAESRAGETNQDTVITVASHIAEHDDSRRENAIDPDEPPKIVAEPVVGRRGFRKSWNEKRSSGSLPIVRLTALIVVFDCWMICPMEVSILQA